MLLATGGTVCLVLMVVVTSIKAARRRLRYESWHLLHLYAYLGVGLALPHQLWTGQQFLSSPGRTVFWWTAWAVAAGSVLVWRVGLPVWRNLWHRLRVTSVVRETDDVVSVYLTGRRLAPAARRGRAVLHLALPRPARLDPRQPLLALRGPRRPQPADHRAGGRRRQRVGASCLRPGTRVLFEGPFGRLSPRARTRRGVALIGAGVGITPLRALAEGLQRGPGDCRPAAPLDHRAAVRPGVRRPRRASAASPCSTCRGRAGTTARGCPAASTSRVDDVTALRHWVPDIAERDVYVCGPEALDRPGPRHPARRRSPRRPAPPRDLRLVTP